MPSEAPPQTCDLRAFAEFLQGLNDEGMEYLVIGGCAVGAYARLAGETVFSADLDLYVTAETLEELLLWAPLHDATVEARPEPRTVPVAVLRWRGLEVNALTASAGLPPMASAYRTSRDFELPTMGTTVALLDPFDLLANKLATNRAKDQPHIALLKVYLAGEVQHEFASSASLRERMAGAKRYLQVLGAKTLPEELTRALMPHANAPPLRRFLAQSGSGVDLIEQLLELAESDEEREQLTIIGKRG